MRVDATTSTTWTRSHGDRDQAGRSLVLASIPNSGISAWLASALSIATTAKRLVPERQPAEPPPDLGAGQPRGPLVRRTRE